VAEHHKLMWCTPISSTGSQFPLNASRASQQQVVVGYTRQRVGSFQPKRVIMQSESMFVKQCGKPDIITHHYGYRVYL